MFCLEDMHVMSCHDFTGFKSQIWHPTVSTLSAELPFPFKIEVFLIF